MIRVGPDEPNPTHIISLSDGKTTIGLIPVDSAGNAAPKAITEAPVQRTALKTASGSTKYADFEPPWSPVAQEDFSGGLGSEDYDLDVTRYWTASGINAAYGKLFLGPQPQYMSGYRSQDQSLPGSLTWSPLTPSSRQYLAVKFTASANYNAIYVWLHVRRRGTPDNPITVELCANSSGNPGTVLQTATISTTNITDTVAEFYRSTISSQSFTRSTIYWIKVYSTGGTEDDHWEVGVNASIGNTKESSAGSSWSASNIDLYYRVTDSTAGLNVKFFQYRSSQYMISNPSSGAPTLYINGDRGTADANTGALTTLVDATKSWTVNAWAGCVVKIIKGTGVAEPQPWRYISSNTSTTLTLSEAWTITHDTTTEYVILGSNTWTVLDTTGLTAPVTDVLVVNNIIYYCQGDAVNIRRSRGYTSTGTWTVEYADDGTNKAVHMEAVRNSSGVLSIWKSNNSDATGDISVANGAIVAWGTNITFSAALLLQDQWGKITGLEEYANYLWIFREGTANNASGTAVQEITLPEIHSAMEYTNGVAHCRGGVYMYFNLGSGVERYYSGSGALDDVGPNKDDGLPADRQGVVTALLGYPGRYFCAVDGGTSNYSSVLMSTGTGWHDVYRSSMKGERIGSLDFQPVPYLLDRMYVQVGGDVIWLPFPSNTLDPTKDASYRYIHEGYLISGYIYSGMVDANKLYQSMKLFTEQLDEDNQVIQADYQVDDETEWTPVDGDFDTSPIQEYELNQDLGVTGKRLRFRIRVTTTSSAISPIIKTTVIENISKISTIYAYSFMFRLRDTDLNLLGEPETLTAAQRQAKLKEWAGNLVPVHMNCVRAQYHNINGFIDPSQSYPINDTSEGYNYRMTITERGHNG